MSEPRHRLIHDSSGKGVLKFAFATCVLAVAVASSSPDFQANPLIGKSVTELRSHLPETLEKITEALGG
jgi:hypothetical protein